jgi:hypothetical protein
VPHTDCSNLGDQYHGKPIIGSPEPSWGEFRRLLAGEPQNSLCLSQYPRSFLSWRPVTRTCSAAARAVSRPRAGQSLRPSEAARGRESARPSAEPG